MDKKPKPLRAAGARGMANGRCGGFFAIDRRAWPVVAALGMNAMVAYLFLARGTGPDNRSSQWSVSSIERRSGISRSRAALAIKTLRDAAAIVLDPSSKRCHPKYKLTPAHELPRSEAFPPPPLDDAQTHVMSMLDDSWTYVPAEIAPRDKEARDRWVWWKPRKHADALVSLGLARRSSCRERFMARPYVPEQATKPDWIWLPNALVDSAASETPPVELVRQTMDAMTLRLLVDLYAAQLLDEDRGLHHRFIRRPYKRIKVGEEGASIVWGFVEETMNAFDSAPFLAPFLTGEVDQTGRDKGWNRFWACWKRLEGLGLVEFVAHLVESDSAEAEIIHPMALGQTGLQIERALADAVRREAECMATAGQIAWARDQHAVALAAVRRHLEHVQMRGIARLRYQPRTSRLLAFHSRRAEWEAIIKRCEQTVSSCGGPPCNIKGHQ